MLKKFKEIKGLSSIVLAKCCMIVLAVMFIGKIIMPAQNSSKEIVNKIKINTVTSDERFSIK